MILWYLGVKRDKACFVLVSSCSALLSLKVGDALEQRLLNYSKQIQDKYAVISVCQRSLQAGLPACIACLQEGKPHFSVCPSFDGPVATTNVAGQTPLMLQVCKPQGPPGLTCGPRLTLQLHRTLALWWLIRFDIGIIIT